MTFSVNAKNKYSKNHSYTSLDNEKLMKESCKTFYLEIKNNSLCRGNNEGNTPINESHNTDSDTSSHNLNSHSTSKSHENSLKNNNACSPCINNNNMTSNEENQIKENKFFLKILPKISHKLFLGKEICPSCNKVVKENQQSVSCDQCNRWTHRLCCKMSSKNYKDLKNKTFDFLCKNCNIKAIDFKNIFQTVLKKDELPDPIDEIKPNKNHIIILHLNCRNLANKGEDLYSVIINSDADIICLTETWYDESHPMSMNVPDGFYIHRKDRSEDFKEKYKKSKGGGVAIMYKKGLKLVVKEKLTPKTEEILWVQVRAKTTFLLGVLYRPDYSDILTSEKENLEENIQNAISISKNTILTGDFNADLFDSNKSETKQLKNILKSYGFIQHIKKPTRINTQTFRKSLLDHFWTCNETIKIEKCGTFFGISDHLGTYMNLNIKKEKEPPIKIKFRNYKKFDPENFKKEVSEKLKNSNFNNFLLEKNVNGATDLIVKTLSETADKHAPFTEKTIIPKSQPPWYNANIQNKINNKNELLKDFYETGHPSLKKRLDTEAKEIKKIKFHLKKDFVNEKVEKADNDISELWKLLNLLTDKPKQKFIEPDKMTQTKANDFNKYFATVGLEIQNQLKDRITNKTLKNPDIESFDFHDEKEETIKKLIGDINEKVATGEDNISAKLIKHCKEIITPYIESLQKTCLAISLAIV